MTWVSEMMRQTSCFLEALAQAVSHLVDQLGTLSEQLLCWYTCLADGSPPCPLPLHFHWPVSIKVQVSQNREECSRHERYFWASEEEVINLNYMVEHWIIWSSRLGYASSFLWLLEGVFQPEETFERCFDYWSAKLNPSVIGLVVKHVCCSLLPEPSGQPDVYAAATSCYLPCMTDPTPALSSQGHCSKKKGKNQKKIKRKANRGWCLQNAEAALQPGQRWKGTTPLQLPARSLLPPTAQFPYPSHRSMLSSPRTRLFSGVQVHRNLSFSTDSCYIGGVIPSKSCNTSRVSALVPGGRQWLWSAAMSVAHEPRQTDW